MTTQHDDAQPVAETAVATKRLPATPVANPRRTRLTVWWSPLTAAAGA